jgi:hypothetical protein
LNAGALAPNSPVSLNLQRLPDHRNKPATVGLDRSAHALRSQPFRVDYTRSKKVISCIDRARANPR